MEATLNVNEHGSVFLEGKTLIIDNVDSEVKAKLENIHIRGMLRSLYEGGYLTIDTVKELEEGEY